MTPSEVQAALDGMVCLVDNREQDTPRLRARLEIMGCKYERVSLNFGDYSARFPLPDGKELNLKDRVVIERKMDFGELTMCYCQSRPRFIREFERAQTAGAKVYLLVEGATWENAYNGKYRSQMQPQALIASILAWCARYRCIPLFCKAETSGRLIHDVLYREGKEILENGIAL